MERIEVLKIIIGIKSSTKQRLKISARYTLTITVISDIVALNLFSASSNTAILK